MRLTVRRWPRRRLSAVEQERLLAGLRASPRDPEAHLRVAWALLVGGRPEPAGAVARWALALDPTCTEAHDLLGLVAERRGRAAEAADHYLDAARIDPIRSIGPARLRSAAAICVVAGGIGGGGAALLSATGWTDRAFDAAPGWAPAVILAVLVLVPVGSWFARGRPPVRQSPEVRAALARDRQLSAPPTRRLVALAVAVALGIVLVVATRSDDPSVAELHDLGTVPPLGCDRSDPAGC